MRGLMGDVKGRVYRFIDVDRGEVKGPTVIQQDCNNYQQICLHIIRQQMERFPSSNPFPFPSPSLDYIDFSAPLPLHVPYYNNLRTVQNMSQFFLSDEPPFRTPNLTHTLLLIETNRCFPVSSAVSIDKSVGRPEEVEQDSSLSLQQMLKHAKHETISSTSLIKKKKGGCTCKKTKCLKMYCECFSSGKLCSPECSCHGCSNDHDHLDSINKAKNAIRLKSLSASKQNQGKGCSCKRSQCQKKYCECFNAGVACGEECRCEECANGCEERGSREKQEEKGRN